MAENYSFEFINHNYTEEAFNYITKEVASITTPVPANILLSHPGTYNINNNVHNNMNNNNSYMNNAIMMMNNLNDQIIMANLSVDNYPQNIMCNNNNNNGSPLNHSSSSVSSTSSLSSPSPTSSPTSLSTSLDYQKLKNDLSLLKPKSELLINNSNIHYNYNDNIAHHIPSHMNGYNNNNDLIQQTEVNTNSNSNNNNNNNSNNSNVSFSLHSSTPSIPISSSSSPNPPKKRRSSSNSINPEVIQSLSNSLLNNNSNTTSNNSNSNNNSNTYLSVDQSTNILLSSFTSNNNNNNRNNKEEEGKEVNNLQISPFVSSVTENYCDITEYLTLPQNQAAKKLQMRPSTFSKRWKEASRNRKWPWRNVRKIDKEITCILHNTPKNGCLSDEVEEHLTTLLRQRQEELRPVVIRIS